ncbi:sensor histidine kinase [soil metagenome]
MVLLCGAVVAYCRAWLWPAHPPCYGDHIPPHDGGHRRRGCLRCDVMTDNPRPGPIDTATTAVLLGLSWLSLFVAHDVGGDEALSLIAPWAEYVLVAAMIVPLAWRRGAPLAILATVTPLALLVWGLKVPEQLGPSLALFVALYTAGARSDHRLRDPLRIVACVGTMVLVFVQIATRADYVGFDLLLLGSYFVAVNGGYLAAAWLLGDATRTRFANERELAHRAEQLAAQQEERARRAVLDERVRIARELHDVVAHHVSVMGVQAAAARRILGGREPAADAPLSAVEQSGRDAVGELQRLVGFLRHTHPDDDLTAEPQPTFADIDRLVASCGLPATLRQVGVTRPVPASVGLSAYRIVQEALTNVVNNQARRKRAMDAAS